MISRLAAASCCLALLVSSARSVDPAPPALSAADLASRLSAWQQDGASYARLRMEVKQPPGTTTLQIQIKARRTKMNTEVVYQILWPKERKEAVLLRKTRDRSVSGSIFVPPTPCVPLVPRKWSLCSAAIFPTRISLITSLHGNAGHCRD
jgi:hypothetical protein